LNLEHSLLDVLFNSDLNEILDPMWNSLGNFAIEVALGLFWIHLNVIPELILGFGTGSFSAAVLSEGIEIKDAMNLIIVRSQLGVNPSGLCVGQVNIQEFLKNVVYRVKFVSRLF